MLAFSRFFTLLIAFAVATTLAGGCASVPAVIPAGPEDGTFFSPPRSKPRFSASMEARRERLNRAVRSELSVQFEVLRDLIESSREFRDQIEKRAAALSQRYEENDEISPLDVELVLEAAHWFIELDAMLYALWTTYRRYLPNGSEPDPYAPYRAATLLTPQIRSKGGLLALTAEMVRMDNARLVTEVLGGELALTHWLNRGDAARGIEPESYDRIVGGFYDPARRILLQDFVQAVDARADALKLSARDDNELAFLLATLERSQSAAALREERALPRQLRFVGAMTTRTSAALLGPVLDLYIRSFNEAATDSETRFARLERIDGLAMQVESSLEPLDIVFVRDGRRKKTAGGMSYAVVYLGRFDQWVEIAPQSNVLAPIVASELRQGDRFLELGPDGVRYLSLDQILLGEALVVVRPPSNQAALSAQYKRVLDVLAEDDIIDPLPRPPPDYGAVLLRKIFTASALGLDESEADLPLLRRLVETTLSDASPVAIVLSAMEDDVIVATIPANRENQQAVKKRVSQALERAAPAFLESE